MPISRREFLQVCVIGGAAAVFGGCSRQLETPQIPGTPQAPEIPQTPETPEIPPLPEADYDKIGPVLYADTNGSLWLEQFRGEALVQITDTLAGRPFWSKDKSRILYWDDRGSGKDIVTCDASGNEVTRVQDTIAYPLVLEDYEGQGKKVIWDGRNAILWPTEYNATGAGIYMLDLADGRTHQLVLSMLDTLDRSPSVSPDGSFLAYAFYRGSANISVIIGRMEELRQRPIDYSNAGSQFKAVFGGMFGTAGDSCSRFTPNGNQDFKVFWMPDSSGLWVVTEGLREDEVDAEGRTLYDYETRQIRTRCMDREAILVSCRQGSEGTRVREIPFASDDYVFPGGGGVDFSPDRRALLALRSETFLACIDTESGERREITVPTQVKDSEVRWVNNAIVGFSEGYVWYPRTNEFYSLHFPSPVTGDSEVVVFW